MQTIDNYLATIEEPHKQKLQEIRELIKKLVPDAEEAISYGIPTFKYKKKNLIHFAGFKHHMSIFPTARPIAELKAKLVGFETAKGTIQFTVDKPLPNAIIKELVMMRVADIVKK